MERSARRKAEGRWPEGREGRWGPSFLFSPPLYSCAWLCIEGGAGGTLGRRTCRRRRRSAGGESTIAPASGSGRRGGLPPAARFAQGSPPCRPGGSARNPGRLLHPSGLVPGSGCPVANSRFCCVHLCAAEASEAQPPADGTHHLLQLTQARSRRAKRCDRSSDGDGNGNGPFFQPSRARVR